MKPFLHLPNGMVQNLEVIYDCWNMHFQEVVYIGKVTIKWHNY
jgi:hypothetical protein